MPAPGLDCVENKKIVAENLQGELKKRFRLVATTPETTRYVFSKNINRTTNLNMISSMIRDRSIWSMKIVLYYCCSLNILRVFGPPRGDSVTSAMFSRQGVSNLDFVFFFDDCSVLLES